MRVGMGHGASFNVHWWGMKRGEFEALMERVRERHPEVWWARRRHEEERRGTIRGFVRRFLPPKPTNEEIYAAMPSLSELGAPAEIQANAEKIAGSLRFDKWRREAREKLRNENHS